MTARKRVSGPSIASPAARDRGAGDTHILATALSTAQEVVAQVGTLTLAFARGSIRAGYAIAGIVGPVIRDATQGAMSAAADITRAMAHVTRDALAVGGSRKPARGRRKTRKGTRTTTRRTAGALSS